jgi:hypothetical protein
MFAMDRTPRGPRARPGRIAERIADERPASRSNSRDPALGRRPARLQQFIKFMRELVGDRGLELSEAIEVDIKGFSATASPIKSSTVTASIGFRP